MSRSKKQQRTYRLDPDDIYRLDPGETRTDIPEVSSINWNVESQPDAQPSNQEEFTMPEVPPGGNEVHWCTYCSSYSIKKDGPCGSKCRRPAIVVQPVMEFYECRYCWDISVKEGPCPTTSCKRPATTGRKKYKPPALTSENPAGVQTAPNENPNTPRRRDTVPGTKYYTDPKRYRRYSNGAEVQSPTVPDDRNEYNYNNSEAQYTSNTTIDGSFWLCNDCKVVNQVSNCTKCHREGHPTAQTSNNPDVGPLPHILTAFWNSVARGEPASLVAQASHSQEAQYQVGAEVLPPTVTDDRNEYNYNNSEAQYTSKPTSFDSYWHCYDPCGVSTWWDNPCQDCGRIPEPGTDRKWYLGGNTQEGTSVPTKPKRRPSSKDQPKPESMGHYCHGRRRFVVPKNAPLGG
ncbi:hypothetical protein EDC01DRAFT_682775 [Geopyxis carbonaria]|nr:hypothetical protein EDC01DRAFT_682775 [Geopyxis carbonaria]